MNDKVHWSKCQVSVCGAIQSSPEEHKGWVKDADKPGKEFCDVCGFEREAQSSTNPPATTDPETKPGEGDEDNKGTTDTPGPGESTSPEPIIPPITEIIDGILNPNPAPQPSGVPVNPTAKPVSTTPAGLPVYNDETPDPNAVDAPESLVVIDQNGSQAKMVKVDDPENVDQKQYTIDGNANPLAGLSGLQQPSWALVNLILAIVSTAVAVYVAVTLKRRREDKGSDEGDEFIIMKRRRFALIAALALGVGNVVLFCLTENLSLSMVLVDGWTWVSALLVVGSTAAILVPSKRANEDDEEATAIA